MFETITKMIAPYVEKDPLKFYTYDEFKKGISALREFCLLRAKSINEQLNVRLATGLVFTAVFTRRKK